MAWKFAMEKWENWQKWQLHTDCTCCLIQWRRIVRLYSVCPQKNASLWIKCLIVLRCVELMIRDKNMSYLKRRSINVRQMIPSNCTCQTNAMRYVLFEFQRVAFFLEHWRQVSIICTVRCFYFKVGVWALKKHVFRSLVWWFTFDLFLKKYFFVSK